MKVLNLEVKRPACVVIQYCATLVNHQGQFFSKSCLFRRGQWLENYSLPRVAKVAARLLHNFIFGLEIFQALL